MMPSLSRHRLFIPLLIIFVLTAPAVVNGQDESTVTDSNGTVGTNTTGTTITGTTADKTPTAGVNATTPLDEPVESPTSDQATAAIQNTTAVTDTTVAGNRSEANDDYQTAPEIRINETIESEIGWQGDIDWFQLEVPEQTSIDVEFRSGSGSNLSVFLYNGGELVDSSYATPGDTVVISEPASSGGPYYVVAKGVESGENATGPYQFEVLTNTDTATNQNQDVEGNNSSGSGSGFSFTLIAGVIVLLAIGTLIWRQT